jgi:RNA polymerase sigma factor (sigma-70 family)
MSSISRDLRHLGSLRLSREEERSLIRRAQVGDQPARNRLIEASLPNLLRLAGDAATPRVEVGDLCSVGVLAVIKAIEEFDLARKNRLWAYALPGVRRAIQEERLRIQSLVRVPYKWIGAGRPENLDEGLLRAALNPAPLESVPEECEPSQWTEGSPQAAMLLRDDRRLGLEQRRIYRRALCYLDRPEREALKLHHHGASLRQIAREQACSYETVRNRLALAERILRRVVREDSASQPLPAGA